jgi:hypothetical protein
MSSFGKYEARRRLIAACALAMFAFGFLFITLPPVMAGMVDNASKTNKSATSEEARTKITDQELLYWEGKWSGTSMIDDKSYPMEIVWKLTMDDRWMQGDMRVWSDARKTSLLHEHFFFVRPSDTAGIYTGYGFSNEGMSLVGRATMKEGVWKWSWTYNNGDKENAEMVCYSMGKMIYKGKVTGSDGTVLTSIDYELNKPTIVQRQQ